MRYARILAGLGALASGVVSAPAAGQEAGEVLWRFELATPFAGDEVSVGPDGTVYAKDNQRLYALTPAGEVKWTRDGLGGGLPVSFLADGAVVTATGDTVHALEPDGETRWTFTYGSNGAEPIQVGPSVGPDGNIYGATSVGGGFGLGAFGLSPEGDLLWSNGGEPLLDNISGTTEGQVRFGDGYLVFHFNFTSIDGAGVYAFTLGGEQLTFVDYTCTSVPLTDGLGRTIMANNFCGVEAVAPVAEAVLWSTDIGAFPALPVIGADSTIYSAPAFGGLTALDPDGSVAWTSGSATDVVRMMAVRQDVGRVVYAQLENFGLPDTVAGSDTADGARLWGVELMALDQYHEFVHTLHAPTSPDGGVVYFTTRFSGHGAPGALYAIRIAEPAGCPADFNGDGELNILDFVAFQNAFTGGAMSADCDGDGELNILDFVCFQNLFQAGCA